MNEASRPTRKAKIRKRLLIAVVAPLAVLLLLAGGTFYYLTYNYAKKEALPLEQSLVAAGAIKQCEYGDSGRGISNREPWYNGRYTFSGDEQKAIEVIEKVAKEHGFTLTHTETAGHNIDRYQDHVTKRGNYAEFGDRAIYLSMAVYGSGTSFGCNGKTLMFDEANLGIILNVALDENR